MTGSHPRPIWPIASSRSRKERDRIICAARAAYYSTTEPLRLRLERFFSEPSGSLPLVSVYIPTHNRVDLLMNRALPSVLRQTYTHFEVIVASHGCTDGTIESVAKIKDPRIVQLMVPRERTYPPTAMNHWLAGPVAPANAALDAVEGDWIARLDDDDVWEPDHLSVMLWFANRGDYEFVSSAHDTPTGPVGPYYVNGIPIGGTQTWLYRSYLKFMRYNPDCWRRRWNRNNDIDLQNRFVRAGVRMGYYDKVTCHVLPRPGETEIGSKAYLADESRTEAMFAFH